MRLAKIKLAGFKSFVDPMTVLTPGALVGVVGPNGCGKSNIIDAVRWVLGESRASALRGDSMQDVIFGGSTSRKPVARASVELVFDNAAGKAGGQWTQYAEIAVRRVLTRDGESSYWINNLRVRRRDVVDLFLGTGLGPRAYAIIEQGTISRVIEARPEDLRMFLEEAAGITKYKERRRETEIRLREARDNLARVADIRAELVGQIERLEAQAAVALRFRELSTTLKQRQSLLWYARRMAAAREREAATRAAEQATIDLERETARLREVERELEAARQSHLDASAGVQSAQSALYEASAEVARLEAELRHHLESRRRVSQRVVQLEQEHLRWAQERTRAEAAESDFSLRIAALEQQLEEGLMALEEARGHLHGCEDAAQSARTASSEAIRALASADQALKVREAHRGNAQRNLAQAEERCARLRSERAALPEADTEALERAREALEMAQEQVGAEQEALEALEDERGRHDDAVRGAEQAYLAAHKAAAETEAQIGALRQVQEKTQRPGRLGDWLRRHGLDGATPLWRSLQVEPGWEAAVEAVLGQRFQGYLQDRAAAGQALRDAPPEAVALAFPVAPHAQEAAPGADSLLARVRCASPQWQPLVARWLAAVRVVDELAAVLETLPAEAGEPAGLLVDRAGHLLVDGAVLPHLPDARVRGALERERELERLERVLEERREAAERASGARDLARVGLQAHRERVAQAREALEATQERAHELRLDVLRGQQEWQRLTDRAGQIERQIAELDAGMERERAALADDEQEAERLQAEVDRLRQALGASADRARAADAALAQARAQERTVSDRYQSLQFAQREAQGRQAENRRTLETARVQVERLLRELQEHQREAERLGGEDHQSVLDAALAARVAREQALARARDAQEGETARLRGWEEQRMRAEQGIGPLRERIHTLGMKIQAAELAETQFRERLQEMDVDPAAVHADYSEGLNETALQGQINRLQNEIGAMGAVNLAAVDELAATRERKAFLDAQNDDLSEAIETLEGAIRRIDRETREQLASTFEFVNERFGVLFPELFGGGSARLILTGEDILDAGVQVSAQPPGKKTSNIHLLSGGEKALTAVALVFGMFQLNPAPFCMLDEVDAPLDDTNTGRFCRMLQKMCSTTQFLFITHSKITMEIAQQLIGVTMQESGVSRIVEVDVEQAMRMHDEAA